MLGTILKNKHCVSPDKTQSEASHCQFANSDVNVSSLIQMGSRFPLYEAMGNIQKPLSGLPTQAVGCSSGMTLLSVGFPTISFYVSKGGVFPLAPRDI